MIAGYQLVLCLAISITAAALVSESCVAAARCTRGEEVATSTLGLAWIGAGVLCIVAGWRGRLWGARARPDAPAAAAVDT